jgi:F0F1-type ATP synthase gamma subunit
MMCYLQLHYTRLSSIFMCFSFFFLCGKFGKQIFRSLNSLFRNKQCKKKQITFHIKSRFVDNFISENKVHVCKHFIYLFFLFITHLS